MGLPASADALLDTYRTQPGRRDEMLLPGGGLAPHYRPLVEALGALSPGEREARFAASTQYLREAGVFYRVYSQGERAAGDARLWPLSHPPVVLAKEEWEGLERGLVQRARYLEALLGDLYGERRLVRQGLLPASLLGRNPELLRPLAQQGLSGEPLIRFIAVDLGRAPDGRWRVLADRTQAPSGAGFALENRVASSRALADLSREMNVRRLAAFFDGFRRTLAALSGPNSGKIGLLSPGPGNETYFEHAYLARYLGFQLLEGGDIDVAQDAAFLRTVEGPAPLSVLWRRLDADFADPLELFSRSAIGTPGLSRAVRAGRLRLVNALGSGLLETRAFLAYEAAVAEALIGETLEMPGLRTQWCGAPGDADEGLSLQPAFPGKAPCVPGDAAGFVRQEEIALSTAPVFDGGILSPRAVSLRVFLALGEDGWAVMPGGFARLSGHDGTLSMQGGGLSADVWVVSDRPEPPVTLLGDASATRRRLPGALPARAADDLFWLGRLTERTEVVARLARMAEGRRREGAADHELTALIEGFVGGPGDPRGALLTLARQALDTAARIRDRFSPDAWRMLAELVALLEEAPGNERLFGHALTQLAGFTGLVRENMYQFTGWRFLQLGRQLERGLTTAHVGARLLSRENAEGALEAVLEFTDSRMTYRRRFSVDLSREAVVDLSILDPHNPRSLAFQANGVEGGLTGLAGETTGSGKRAARLAVRLRTAAAIEVDPAFLTRIVGDFAAISDEVSARYFRLSGGRDKIR